MRYPPNGPMGIDMQIFLSSIYEPGGGTDLERGYGDVRP